MSVNRIGLMLVEPVAGLLPGVNLNQLQKESSKCITPVFACMGIVLAFDTGVIRRF